MSAAPSSTRRSTAPAARSTGEDRGDSKAAVAAQLRLRGLTVVDVDEKKSAMTVEDILDNPRRQGPQTSRSWRASSRP